MPGASYELDAGLKGSKTMSDLAFSADTRNRNVGPASAPPLAVYVGRECIGFIRPLGDAFEALDLDRRSLGVFSSRSAAADAIEETRR
jgi:hypothetical protein